MYCLMFFPRIAFAIGVLILLTSSLGVGDPGIPRFVALGRMLPGLLLGVSMMVLDRGMGWEVSRRVLGVGGGGRKACCERWL